MSRLQIVCLVELFACWIAWSMAFLKPREQATGRKEVASAPASRWGIFLVMVGFALAWAYVRPAGFEKPAWALIFSMILAPPSVVLAWSATRHLGKQWRYKAALREGHELIQSGPYAHVRHPIYLSMLGMLVATLAAWTWWPMAIGSLIAFMAGTEIRIRAEERLLGSHFGAAYVEYKRRSKAYIPFVR
ncbi:MAG: isoprenylcysteine carboxylmethyltransferase family protein [Terracidiphilus sp.]|jgi:protein-S-isoprenylcysteine O-methyltransferase Ste14